MPLKLGLDNSSCESDEYTDFDVFLRTPPNNARGTMHCTELGFHTPFEELVKRKKIWCSVYAQLRYSK